MIKSIIVGISLALASGAPVYAADAGPSGPAAPKAAVVVACEAYVYKGTGTNLCGAHPTATDLDCAQLAKPVTVVVKGVDPWNLDIDADGVGCDLPAGPASSSASASASAKPSASASTSSGPAAATAGTSSTSSTSAVTDAGSLPLTGPSPWVLGGLGVLVLAVGGAAVVATRRRRARFEA